MKKGITLVAISTIIVILFVIMGVVAVNGKNALELARKVEFLTEILDLQQKTLDYYKEEQELPVFDLGINVNTRYMSSSELEEFIGETRNEGNITLYKLDKTKLGISNLQFGNEETTIDIYAVSAETKRVYYLKGIKADNMVYYTYTNAKINSLYIPRNVQTNQDKMVDAIFERSSNDYTNQPITTKVLLPTDATNITVTVTNSKSVSEGTYEGLDKVIYVNSTSQDRNGNYDIEVTYTYDATVKTVTYKVQNFDNVAPIASAIIGPVVGERREIGITATDELSDISVIKCEIGTGYTADYFKTYGTVARNGVCTVKEHVSYTVYVEDKASNYVLLELTR